MTAFVFREDALAPGAPALWHAALDHLARRYAAIRPLDPEGLPEDRTAAASALDRWAGDEAASWRREVARFYDDHARMHLRRDAAAGGMLRRLRADGARVGAYGEGPQEASRAVLGFLGLERRLDAVAYEPADDPFAAACAALGSDPAATRHLRTRADVEAL